MSKLVKSMIDAAKKAAQQFRWWRERLTAENGALPDRIRYTRKSTVGEGRQEKSHDQQWSEMDKLWGPLSPNWWWLDSSTGTTFDRPGFQDLLAFCQANPRPKTSPGRVEMYDPSRFGRILDEDGDPDLMRFIAVFGQFESSHWIVEFVTIKRTGDGLVDIIMMALYAYAAAIYSKDLSKSVKRGRTSHASEGCWVNGRAPWGTKRFDTKADRVLEDKEKATHRGSVILVPDEEVLKHWEPAAKRVLAGVSLDKIGADLRALGIMGPRGGNLGHASIRNFLTNPALIGIIEFNDQPGDDGVRERKRVNAKWPPMVDVVLFAKVSERLSGHSRADKPRKRKQRELFPLGLTCAHCGVDYNGGRNSKTQNRQRTYVHAQPKARMDPEGYARFVENGCKVWSVDAEELETKVKDLILSERTTEDFVDEVRGLVLERDEFRQTAQEAVESAESEVAKAKAQRSALAVMAARLAAKLGAAAGDAANSAQIDAMVDQMAAADQRTREAEAELVKARSWASSRERAWEKLEAIIRESRNLASAWEAAGPEERRILFDYWVLDLMIVTEPIPGMKRANRKTALVRLRNAPNAPRHFELASGSQLVRDASRSPESSSSRTAGSSSESKRSRKAAAAAGEPILPSAQAEWERTSGSASESAVTNAGTSASEPTLPSTTAELRFRPLNLARFTGDPLNAAENSDCDMASSSSASERASLPASEGLGAYGDPSASSDANLRLYGQTAWQMSHP